MIVFKKQKAAPGKNSLLFFIFNENYSKERSNYY